MRVNFLVILEFVAESDPGTKIITSQCISLTREPYMVNQLLVAAVFCHLSHIMKKTTALGNIVLQRFPLRGKLNDTFLPILVTFFTALPLLVLKGGKIFIIYFSHLLT